MIQMAAGLLFIASLGLVNPADAQTTVPPTTTTTAKPTHACGHGSDPPLNIPIDEPCPSGSVVVITVPTPEVTSSPPTSIAVRADSPAIRQSSLSDTPPVVQANQDTTSSISTLPTTGATWWRPITGIAVFFLLVGTAAVAVVRDARKDGGVKL